MIPVRIILKQEFFLFNLAENVSGGDNPQMGPIINYLYYVTRGLGMFSVNNILLNLIFGTDECIFFPDQRWMVRKAYFLRICY